VRVAKEVATSSGTRATQTETDWIFGMLFSLLPESPYNAILFWPAGIWVMARDSRAGPLKLTGRRKPH
jgi:hypothetical protein